MSVSDTDDFLMFHNAGAFCCQLFDGILNLYGIIFFHCKTNDPVVITMRVFVMLCVSTGLGLTTAGGIMVNHYVSTKACCFIPVYVHRELQRILAIYAMTAKH